MHLTCAAAPLTPKAVCEQHDALLCNTTTAHTHTKSERKRRCSTCARTRSQAQVDTRGPCPSAAWRAGMLGALDCAFAGALAAAHAEAEAAGLPLRAGYELLLSQAAARALRRLAAPPPPLGEDDEGASAEVSAAATGRPAAGRARPRAQRAAEVKAERALALALAARAHRALDRAGRADHGLWWRPRGVFAARRLEDLRSLARQLAGPICDKFLTGLAEDEGAYYSSLLAAAARPPSIAKRGARGARPDAALLQRLALLRLGACVGADGRGAGAGNEWAGMVAAAVRCKARVLDAIRAYHE